MGISMSGRQGRPEQPPADLETPASAVQALDQDGRGPVAGGSRPSTQGDTGRRRSRSSSRDSSNNTTGSNNNDARPAAPAMPPSSPRPLPVRPRIRSRSRQPLGPLIPDQRLMAAYYSEAMAVDKCSKAQLMPNRPCPQVSQTSELSQLLHLPPPSTAEPSVASGIVTPPSPGQSESRYESVNSSITSADEAKMAALASPAAASWQQVSQPTESPAVCQVAFLRQVPVDGPATPAPSEASTTGAALLLRLPGDGVSNASEAARSRTASEASRGKKESEARKDLVSLAPSEIVRSEAASLSAGPGGGRVSLASSDAGSSQDTGSLADWVPRQQTSDSGDAREGADKDSEEDIDVGSIPMAHDGFYFGAMAHQDDNEATDYFEKVQIRTLTSFDASRSPDADSRSVIDEDELKTDELGDEKAVEDANAEDDQTDDTDQNHEDDGKLADKVKSKKKDVPAQPEVTEPETTSDGGASGVVDVVDADAADVHGVQPEPAADRGTDRGVNDPPGDVDTGSVDVEVLSGVVVDDRLSDVVDHVSPELTEIARASMALTAASSSVPDSESVPLFGVEDDVVDTVEGAGDDVLVGCDIKHVAGGLFDPAQSPPAAVALVKGGSLPANTATSGKAGTRSRIGALAAFKARRREKAQRCATASALIPCPEPARVVSTPSEDDSEPEGAAKPRTAPSTRISVDLKVADIKSERGASSQRLLSDVFQGIKQAILPRKTASGRRIIRKRQRSGHRLHTRRTSTAGKSDEQVNEAAAVDQADTAVVVAAPPVDSQEEACVVSNMTSSPRTRSQRSSRIPSEEGNPSAGVKKNYVEPSMLQETESKTICPPSKSNASRTNCQDNDTHSRSSRSSIAPPRTNFLTEDVLKSLARSSSIKYIDTTLRSNMRHLRKTPERYRNIPPPVRRPESRTSGSTNPCKANSPRPPMSKKGYNVRKRLKTSETIIYRGSSASVDIDCLKDHKEDNKYIVYTVNDDNVTELRLSEFVLHEEPAATVEEVSDRTEAKSTVKSKAKSKKIGQVPKAASRKPKKGSGVSTTAVKPRDSAIIRRQQSSIVDKIIHKPAKKAAKCGSVFRSKRSPTEKARPKRGDAVKANPGAVKATSSLSLKTRQTAILERLRQFSPSDCVVEIVADETRRVTEDTQTVVQFSERFSSRLTERRSAFTSRQSSAQSVYFTHTDDSTSPLVSRSKEVTKQNGRRGSAPRYRQTLRTPRISFAGMNAGNEVTVRKDLEADTRAVTRARVPYKHGSKSPRTAFQLSRTSKKSEPSSTPTSSRSRAPIVAKHNVFSGLREVTEMLCELTTLTAGSGRSFTNISELVSLFEAPTKASLPSVGNDSHMSTRPSIDEVLEEVHRSAGLALQGGKAESWEEGESNATSELPGHLHEEDEPNTSISDSERQLTSRPLCDQNKTSSFKVRSDEAEAKVSAALQEILNSLTDLRCMETASSRLDGEVSQVSAQENYSCAVTRQPVELTIKPEKEPIKEIGVACDGKPPYDESHKKCDHPHGFLYKPPMGPSTFDLIENVLEADGHRVEPTSIRDEPLEETLKRFGQSVKINTWTFPPVQTDMVSDSVQAKASTANVECQRTGACSPQEETLVASPAPDKETKNLCSASNSEKLFGKREPAYGTNSPHLSLKQSSIPVCEKEITSEDQYRHDLRLQDFELSDYAPELIPRSHHDMVKLNSDSKSFVLRAPSKPDLEESPKTPFQTSEHPPRSSQERSAQPGSSGFERAQKRIASCLEEDIPATYLAVLTEMLPIFLERTKSDLETPRQKVMQRCFYDDYFSHPVNAADDQPAFSPSDDPQTRWFVASMARQVALLVEDTARSAELQLAGGRQPP